VEDLSARAKTDLSDEKKLIKFTTHIPAFMYLTNCHENTLQDVITKLEPKLFLTVTRTLQNRC